DPASLGRRRAVALVREHADRRARGVRGRGAGRRVEPRGPPRADRGSARRSGPTRRPSRARRRAPGAHDRPERRVRGGEGRPRAHDRAVQPGGPPGTPRDRLSRGGGRCPAPGGVVTELRIAMIGARGVPATFGGVERHVEELGARLADRGHHVTVYCRTNYVTDHQDRYRGMRLRTISTVGTKHLDAIVHSGLATADALRAGADVVHYHAIGPGIPAFVPRYATRMRVIQTIHGLAAERAKWGRGAKAALRGGEWLSAHVPDTTIVVARNLADHYQRTYGREVRVIPNGVDAGERSEPAQITERWGLTAGSYALFVGRLVPEKAPDLLLRAWRSLPGDRRLVIVGG